MKWVCPKCGIAKLAPSKPRRDDVRRYCLACSEETGRLVPRHCPALDQKRDRRESARKTRTAETRAKERATEAAKYTVDGIDGRAELRKIWKIAAEIQGANILDPLPTFIVRRSRSKKYTTGHAYYGAHRLIATVGTEADRAVFVELIAHEVAHFATPLDAHHGPAFYRMLGEILERGYGLDKTPAYRRGQKWDCGLKFIEMLRATEWFKASGGKVT